MKITITGATGRVGRALCYQLAAEGHEPRVLSRSPSGAAWLLPGRTRCFAWDVNAGQMDSEALRGVDCVLHLAGEDVAASRWSSARKKAIQHSRIDSAALLMKEIAALPKEERPKAFIGASAVGYYGDRSDEKLDEQAKPGSGFLAETCVAWEAASQRAADLGLRVALVRIGVVLEREGGALARLLPLFRLGLGGAVGNGRQWMSWIHRDDLVSILQRLIEDETLSGVFNAVAPHAVRNQDFSEILAGQLARPAWIPAPATALRLGLGEMSSIVLASQRVIPQRLQDIGFNWQFPNLDAALVAICSDLYHTIYCQQWLEHPVHEVFSFFSDAKNLERITPPFLGFRIQEMSSREMEAGTRLRYALRLHGVPVRWTSEIADWSPPEQFVDEQVSGPYRRWTHQHRFFSLGEGTLIEDTVRYALPLGALGDFVAHAFVRKDLEKIFAYRHEAIRRYFT